MDRAKLDNRRRTWSVKTAVYLYGDRLLKVVLHSRNPGWISQLFFKNRQNLIIPFTFNSIQYHPFAFSNETFSSEFLNKSSSRAKMFRVISMKKSWESWNLWNMNWVSLSFTRLMFGKRNRGWRRKLKPQVQKCCLIWTLLKPLGNRLRVPTKKKWLLSWHGLRLQKSLER